MWNLNVSLLRYRRTKFCPKKDQPLYIFLLGGFLGRPFFSPNLLQRLWTQVQPPATSSFRNFSVSRLSPPPPLAFPYSAERRKWFQECSETRWLEPVSIPEYGAPRNLRKSRPSALGNLRLEKADISNTKGQGDVYLGITLRNRILAVRDRLDEPMHLLARPI